MTRCIVVARRDGSELAKAKATLRRLADGNSGPTKAQVARAELELKMAQLTSDTAALKPKPAPERKWQLSLAGTVTLISAFVTAAVPLTTAASAYFKNKLDMGLRRQELDHQVRTAQTKHRDAAQHS